jgi:hypothetical protein
MKVRVSYTVDATDALRRALNAHYGREGLATREQVKRWYEDHGANGADDLLDADEAAEGQA